VSQQELNLGILAHVDAGKTTLTERLLYAAGVIDEIGSVDAGTTQTDFLDLERQRGITIRSAVVSFTLGDVHVNLIDTPGHPDFIAEVERVLSVLDGAVLVVSAVEGVQPQTRILFHALQRLGIPALIFVNKIDRPGAGEERVLRAVSERLTPAVVALGSTHRLGTRSASFAPFDPSDSGARLRLAEVLAEHDDAILASFVEGDVSYGRLREALAAQTRQGLVHPAFFGSALTGAGVDTLLSSVPELLPSASGDPEGPLAAAVFKIERGPRGEKVTYVRVESGTLHVRDRVQFGGEGQGKVTSLVVFQRGAAERETSVSAGAIAKVWGLGEIQVGDRLGEAGSRSIPPQFPPPTFEAVVAADDAARLRLALGQLAEQDPLINVRRDDRRHELAVSLYGEVQQEVLQATLASEYGLDVEFRELTPIYVERPSGSGYAIEVLHGEGNPFNATIGLRVDPAPDGAGSEFRVDVDPESVPLYVYKTIERFAERMGEYVDGTLREGLCGWQVVDAIVTLADCAYSTWDGPPSRRGPTSTAADFRKLTPIALMRALDDGGTVVCEPMLRALVEAPSPVSGRVLTALHRVGSPPEAQTSRGELVTIEALVPAARASGLQRELARLTGGEGVVESGFVGYRPVAGPPPTRRRTTPNPLNRAEYLMHLAHRATSIAGESSS
jgi:ribosomal protection tetracycline resistance protein